MRIGIDLGGSKIEGLVLGPAKGADGRSTDRDLRKKGADGPSPDRDHKKEFVELARRRVATPAGDYAAIVVAVAGLVAELAAEAGAGADLPVGVGIPGAISPATRRVKNANSTCLIGHAFDKDLARALARPVRLANDADCFAVSEATDGAGRGVDMVFGVILGTGCGGGVAVGGRLLAGPNAIAGEWGHNPLPWPRVLDGVDERPGPECYCGRRGCIETFVSGTGLERDFEQATGKKLRALEIVALADQGDTQADAALRRYEHRLARALASVINVLDPGVIVLGGGVSNAKRLYANVPRLWGQWVFSDTVATPLKPALHGDSSGVRGAAWLWEGDRPP